MAHKLRRIGTILVWSFGLIVSAAAARYFFESPLFLRPPHLPWLPQGPEADAAANVAPYLFENHRWLFRLHIACGIAAMTLGLFQFIAALRRARPAIHRSLGIGYVTAALLGVVTGFPLSFSILEAVPDACGLPPTRPYRDLRRSRSSGHRSRWLHSFGRGSAGMPLTADG